MKIENILENYADKISISQNKGDLLKKYIKIKNELSKNYEVLVTGSYGRETSILPLEDIDIYIILSKDIDLIKKETPKSLLNKTENILKEILEDNVAINKQTHSIGINLKNKNNEWLRIDIVPAIKFKKGFYVPEVDWRYKDIQRWFISDPLLHSKIINTVDDRLDKKIKPIIKLVKKWLRLKQNKYKVFKKVQTFHFEFLTTKIFNKVNKIESLQKGLNIFFLNSLSSLNKPCLVRPENKKVLIDDYLTIKDMHRIKKNIKKDLRIIEKALKLEEKGKDKKAIKKWDKLFNGDLLKNN